jgi:predicted dehydrogenase
VGLIGAGSASLAYLRTLDDLVARGLARAGAVVASSDGQQQRLDSARPRTRTVPTLDALFDDGVDLVVVTTPPDSHADLARTCLDHGVHVVVEKPLAATVGEARELFDLASARGLLLAAAPFVHLSPAMRLLASQVGGGVIGDVHSARGLYGNIRPTWASWYREQRVGPLGDLAVYNISSLAFLLGPVAHVRCRESRSSRCQTGDVADVVHVMLDHESGARSTVMASHAVHGYRRPALELYGTRGTANLLGDDWNPTGIDVHTDEWGHWRSFASPDPTWNWTDGLRTAVAAISGAAGGGLDSGLSLHVVDVLAAARGSAEEDGSPHPVPSSFPLEPIESVDRRDLHDPTRPPDLQ